MVAIVAGVPEWWCIVALAAAMVVFSEEGGVKATIWTDVIQLGVYLIGAGVVVRRSGRGAVRSRSPGSRRPAKPASSRWRSRPSISPFPTPCGRG